MLGFDQGQAAPRNHQAGEFVARQGNCRRLLSGVAWQEPSRTAAFGKTFAQVAEPFLKEYGIITEGEHSKRWIEGHEIRLWIHLLPFFGELGISHSPDDIPARAEPGIEKQSPVARQAAGSEHPPQRGRHAAPGPEDWHSPRRAEIPARSVTAVSHAEQDRAPALVQPCGVQAARHCNAGLLERTLARSLRPRSAASYVTWSRGGRYGAFHAGRARHCAHTGGPRLPLSCPVGLGPGRRSHSGGAARGSPRQGSVLGRFSDRAGSRLATACQAHLAVGIAEHRIQVIEPLLARYRRGAPAWRDRSRFPARRAQARSQLSGDRPRTAGRDSAE
jgi:hypothetical protein